MRQEAIYARQSVDKKDRVSIEAQIEQCKALARTQEPLVFQDKGFSGKDMERPDLQRLFEAIRSGLPDTQGRKAAKKKGNNSLSKYEDMKGRSVYLTNIRALSQANYLYPSRTA